MTNYANWNLPNFDVLAGGTPCQGFSVAGLRKGLDDPRSQLSLTYVEIAARFRPRWLVFENVPGVLSSGGGRDFAQFLGALTGREISPPAEGWENSGVVEGIPDAYGVAWRVLDAQHCGVPQRRRRVFLVGYLGDWRRAAAVLFERHSVSGNPPPRREAGENIAHQIAPSIGASGRGFSRAGETRGQDPVIACEIITSHDPACTLTARDYKGPLPEADLSTVIVHALRGHSDYGPGLPCLRAKCGDAGGGSELFVTHSLRAEGHDASEDGTGRGTPLVPIAFSCKDYGADAGEASPTLRGMGHDGSHANGGGQVAIAFTQNQAGDVLSGDVMHSLGTNQNSTDRNAANINQGWAVRRITPTEGERLQGFEDGYTLVPVRGKPAADGPRYKALGNSWAVPLARWIGQRIQLVETL